MYGHIKIEGVGSEITIELPARLAKEAIPAAGHLISQAKVEKISIEFSDIYSFE